MPDRLTGRTLVIATGHDLSVALLEDDEVRSASNVTMARGHAEALMPAIEALLAPFGGASAGCARIVVETGPGSFTGLRVGLAAARALSLAWRIPVAGVRSTVLVAAAVRAAGEGGRLLVALQAPRGQVWVECFERGGVQSLLEPVALHRDAVESLAKQYELVAGTWAGAASTAVLGGPPSAAAIHALAPASLGEAELLYVRARDDEPCDSHRQ